MASSSYVIFISVRSFSLAFIPMFGSNCTKPVAMSAFFQASSLSMPSILGAIVVRSICRVFLSCARAKTLKRIINKVNNEELNFMLSQKF